MQYIRLVGLTSVYVNPGLWLVDLAVLVYLPLMQMGSPPLKVNIKIFQLGTTFKILGQIMQNFQIVMITFLVFESENWSENCNLVAEKLAFEYLPCTIQWGFPMLSPFTAPVPG